MRYINLRLTYLLTKNVREPATAPAVIVPHAGDSFKLCEYAKDAPEK